MFKRTFAAVVCLSLVSVSASVSANLRAPLSIAPGPSSALYAQGDALTVVRENLRFSCDFDRASLPGTRECSVTATYYVKASDNGAGVVLNFVAPTSGEFSWMLMSPDYSAQLSGTVAFERYTDTVVESRAIAELVGSSNIPSNEFVQGFDRGRSDTVRLYHGEFHVAFNPGINILEVEYEQRPGVYEYAYGYLSSSRYEQFIDYEIWPIKEWKLSDKFELNIQVELSGAVTGWWSRIRSRQDAAWIVAGAGMLLPPDSISASKRTLVGHWSVTGDDLPDRIRVFIGPYERQRHMPGYKPAID